MRTTAFPPTVQDDSFTFHRPHFSPEAGDGPSYVRQIGNAEAAPEGRFTVAEVAALSTERISAMGRRELIEVIRSVRGGHLLPEVRERLPQMDAETLRRLVFLT